MRKVLNYFTSGTYFLVTRFNFEKVFSSFILLFFSYFWYLFFEVPNYFRFLWSGFLKLFRSILNVFDFRACSRSFDVRTLVEKQFLIGLR